VKNTAVEETSYVDSVSVSYEYETGSKLSERTSIESLISERGDERPGEA
jgi:hypothetical protein